LDSADQTFADAIPTSFRGHAELMLANGSSEDSLEVRHARTLMAYLARLDSVEAATLSNERSLHLC
jgi:hypothetical protein